MTTLDWVVLVGTIFAIVAYGTWKTRGPQDMAGYLKGGASLTWPTIGLSVMATQASAITFLSTPGQAYEDGMRFVQFYFGLPLAMVVISAVFIPIYYRLKVYTAYEYLERRFDAKVRYLGALLFLIQRGLAAGITIYAPAIILSSILGWSLNATIGGIGVVVILYTVLGGTKTVSQTQKHQMVVMMGGMIAAAFVIGYDLSDNVSLPHAVKVAGALGRMNVVDFSFDLNNRYNFWSGITGGFFLALSYFGTDQSQVQRYLTGRSVTESRLGLLFNGVFKIPMQALILFIGVLVFVFYVFVKPPVFFNQPTLEAVRATPHAAALAEAEARYGAAFEAQKAAAAAYVARLEAGADDAAAKAALAEAGKVVKQTREDARRVVQAALPEAETKDADYVFISFVLSYLPAGLVGLLIAVIMSAAMSSTASELNALGSTTYIDLYQRALAPTHDDRRAVQASKLFTALWGGVALAFAATASLLDNLIEAVNILGSIFYGTVLGLFLVAFFMKRVSATPVFLAALVAQATVVTLFFTSELGFLWYNVVGCFVVMLVAGLLQAVGPWPQPEPASAARR
ncbi:MAG: sodium:solute symporter [Myxococcales bacterium]|nr:sodium:solute symporter [Myxococcales bacterium]